jgi:hypothetical protein
MDWQTLLAMLPWAVVFMAQHWFHTRQVNKLLDKLMSRNYTEYVQSKNLERPREAPQPVGEVNPLDVSYEAEQADKMNTMMGMG